MIFHYHPEAIDLRWFTPEWFGARCSDLFRTVPQDYRGSLEFGFDRQYDRTIDEDGNPGEYVQVWMRIEEE